MHKESVIKNDSPYVALALISKQYQFFYLASRVHCLIPHKIPAERKTNKQTKKDPQTIEYLVA